jgi:hypothetical protein
MPNRVTSQLALDPDAIRRRASSIAGCIEVPTVNQQPKKSPAKSFGSKLASPAKNGNNSSNNNSTVSFLVGATGPKAVTRVNGSKSASSLTGVDELARVTIYCDTGTVATARLAANGAIRHVFRRNVTSLDVVERCLKYPALLPKIDWQLLSMTDNSNSVQNESENSNRQQQQSIKQNLELCDVGIAILQSECEKLVLHANALSSHNINVNNTSTIAASPVSAASVTVIPSQTPTTAGAGLSSTPPPSAPSAVKTRTPVSTETSNSNRRQPPPPPSGPTNITGGPATTTSGMEFQFSLAERPMKHVDQCLTDIQKMNKIVHAVSTNGIGTVFLYGNGGVAYTPNIPRTLYQKLSQLRYSKVHSSRPQYVSLGSRERYFVAFHDGTVSYKGPKGLDKELRKLTPPGSATTPTSAATAAAATKQLWPLRSVAFGSAYDTFCIVFQDGSFRYQGKSFPKELEDSLNQSTGNTGTKHHSTRSMMSRNNKNTFHGSDNYHQYHAADSIQMSRQESNTSTTSTGAYSNNNNMGSGGRLAAPVTCINLGPSSEWFLRMDDGRMEWGGISEEMDEAIQQLIEDGHRLNYFDFGEDSSYFVSYD